MLQCAGRDCTIHRVTRITRIPLPLQQERGIGIGRKQVQDDTKENKNVACRQENRMLTLAMAPTCPSRNKYNDKAKCIASKSRGAGSAAGSPLVATGRQRYGGTVQGEIFCQVSYEVGAREHEVFKIPTIFGIGFMVRTVVLLYFAHCTVYYCT